jgi:hypothetical protein
MQQYTIRLTKVTGMLIIAQQSTRVYTGTKEELGEIYKKVQLHNLGLGWWGVIAFIWNLVALYRNNKYKKQLDAL